MIHHIPAHGSENSREVILPGAFGGKKTVPLTVNIKDGHLVNPGEGERIVIGEATVDGTQVDLVLMDRIPDAVMDSLVGMSGARFSFAIEPDPEELPVLFEKKDWYPSGDRKRTPQSGIE